MCLSSGFMRIYLDLFNSIKSRGYICLPGGTVDFIPAHRPA